MAVIHKLMRWSALIGLVACGWLAPGWHQVASAQTVTTCHAAEEKGVDGPVDYGAYCWIDFTPLNLALARGVSGQPFRVDLRGGAYLTFTLRIIPGNTAGNNMYAVAVPSWSGAAFGNSAFNSIPGNPILYQDQANQSGPQDTVTLSALTLHDNGSTELPFVFVAADGESSNENETLSFTTTGAAWSLVSAPGESNPARNMPVLSPPTTVGNSTGSQTVDIAGTPGGIDGEGSYVFTTDNSPGTVTATMQGGGLQGVLFGVKYHTIGLSLTKTHVGEFKAGGTGTYIINTANTVIYPQINPPTTPQPIRVVDTLPAGLTYVSASGTGWSCSAVGQVVTCNTTSLQDLTTSRTFPPITLVVDIASNAPATLVNLAEVSDPTTSTLVFNVCEVADNGVCPNSATSSTGHETAVIHSNLSTSTKSVLDKNGGTPRPGDVLRYTITLTENAGVDATGVSVDDHMPANVGSLAIISTPAGSTDTSTTTGGNNGTGRVRISGITVPANGSVAIVYEVTIAAGTADGTAIDNTAVVTNPDTAGAGANAVAPTVTVAQPQAPGATGNKVLYLYNTGTATANRYMNRVPQTNGGTERSFTEGGSNYTFDYVLTPALAKPLVLSPGSTVTAALTVQRTGANNSGQTTRTMSAQLYKKNGTNYTLIGSDTVSFTSATYHTETFSFTVPNGAAGSLAVGNELALRVTNTSSGSGTRSVNLSQFTSGLRSTVSFDTATVINVDSVQTYANASCTGSPVSAPYQVGSTVYLCAVVSDPFGSSDIAPSSGGTIPTILISDAGGTALASGSMTQVATATATKTFRYTYTVPPTTSMGAWNATVTAWEGTEGTVYRTGSGTFTVAAPPPNLSTSAKTVEDRNGGDALNGDVLRYTITLTESAGSVANAVAVVDDMPAHVGSLTVISRPAGSTDASTTGGGANGTGRLNITGITVPAGGSATIVYDVTIVGNPPAGTTIDNSADIDNPGGTDVVVSAPTVTVNASSGSQSGNKYLYLRNEATITRKLSRSRPTSNGTTVTINGGGSQNDWELAPAIPNGETLALPTTISGSIVMATTGNDLNTNRTVRMSLWRGGTQLGVNVDRSVNGATPGAYAYGFTIPAGTTLAAGQTLTLRIQNLGSSGRNIDVHQRNGTTWTSSYSHLVFNTTTVIDIDAAGAYSQPFSMGNGTKAAYIEDEHVYLRATVSDPFGTADIGSVAVAIKNPTGTVIASGAMTPQPDADPTDGSLTYEFVFTVPTGAPVGGWTATVTAKEGVEDMVQDTANIGFVVQGRVSLGKTWGVDATPGDTVTLTIGGATATTPGTSTAGGSTTAATAAAAGGAALALSEAFTTGSAGNYTISLACSRTKDGLAVATSGTGLSRTIVMPADSGVACTWTNARTVALTVVKLSTVHSDPVNGTSNPKAIPGAFIDYLITIVNPSAVPVDADSVWLTDVIPEELAMVVADLVAPGSGPVEFTDGSPASGLVLGVSDVQFSNDGGATWAYVPTAGSDGTDALVKALRINPKGTFNANNAAFQVRFRTRVR